MKTIIELEREALDIEEELKEMHQRCLNENREPIAQEVQRAQQLMDRSDQIHELIKLEKRRQEQQARNAAGTTMTIPKPEPDKTGEYVTASRIETPKVRDKQLFRSLGDQLHCIMRAGMGQRIDPRLYEVRAATGLSEAVGSDGGFLLQEDFSAALLNDAFATGVLASRCREITLSANANSIKIPGIDETSRASTRMGGMLGYWTDEAAEKTASKPKFRKIELNLNKLVVLVYATDELLEDASVLESVVRMGAAQEIGFQLDDAIINGSGVGQPLGILNAGCLVSQAAETGQTAATVVFENVIKMWSRLFASSQPQAVWLINQNVFPQLATMSIAVGTGGGPVWLPAGGASSSPYSTLMGRPVIPIEQCQTVGTVGDIYLADFANGYILARKGGIQSDMSIHVRFIYDESVFRFVVRVDGQPVRASALTPYKGGANWTQSHFVALATRS